MIKAKLIICSNGGEFIYKIFYNRRNTMPVKKHLSKIKFLKKLYHRFVLNERDPFKCKKTFIDRQKGSDKLCIILAGYKEFLYPKVFGRIIKYTPKDIDVCIVSSGKYSDTLADLCEKNNWSYLSTKKNNVSLVQNIAINLHPNAKYIFKLDEDIFITENYFENMIKAYEHSKARYNTGVIAPLIPINGYGHMRILSKYNLTDKYSAMFEKPVYAAGSDRQIESNPEVAKFFWGDGGFVPDIDEMNRQFQQNAQEERACPIRFSIGAIMFERSLWEEMNYFTVYSGVGMGCDEVDICTYCCIKSRPLLVSENIVVGHLSFGKQNKAMEEYFHIHKDRF